MAFCIHLNLIPVARSSNAERLNRHRLTYSKRHVNGIPISSNRFSVSTELQIARFIQPKQMSLEIDFHVTIWPAVLVNMVCD